MTDSSNQPPQPGPVPPQGYYQQPPPQKSHFWRNCLIVGAIVVVVGIIGIIALVALIGGAANQVAKEENKTHHVVYMVSGSAPKADLTYTIDGSGTTEQRSGQSLPWKKKITVKGTFNFLDISAQNTGAKGSVTCTITVDGKLKKKATSHGAYAIADCNGLQ